MNPFPSLAERVARLLHPQLGVLRGIFGDEMPKAKGGPDKDDKLLTIRVGELREIDAVLRELSVLTKADIHPMEREQQ